MATHEAGDLRAGRINDGQLSVPASGKAGHDGGQVGVRTHRLDVLGHHVLGNDDPPDILSVKELAQVLLF